MVTAPRCASTTSGYAASHVILISESRDGHVTTAPVTLGQVADVDTVFATNAVVGIRPVSVIDGIQWSNKHPPPDTLHQEYVGLPAEPL